MGRSRKHQHRLPSIIDSDMDRSNRSSLQDNGSSGSDWATLFSCLQNTPLALALWWENVPKLGGKLSTKPRIPQLPFPNSTTSSHYSLQQKWRSLPLNVNQKSLPFSSLPMNPGTLSKLRFSSKFWRSTQAQHTLHQQLRSFIHNSPCC